MALGRAVWLVPVALACHKAPDSAPASLDEALLDVMRAHDQGNIDAEASTLRELVLSSFNLDESSPHDRALTPTALSTADIEDFEHPDLDPSVCIGVIVARRSEFDLSDHAMVQLLADQTPVEPYSPDKYDREFLEGEDCWESKDCADLRTDNDLIKDNLLMTLPYQFYKDFRWFDDDNGGGIIAWPWVPESAYSESGNSGILQSYGVEIWFPEDGGTVRALAVWADTKLSVSASDDLVAATTVSGIERNFEAVDEYLAEQ